MRVDVLDLSHHDEDAGGIDFHAIRDAQVQAVVLKATDGMTYSDKTYADHLTRAQSVGLKVGAYHFLRAGSIEKQVTRFLAATPGVFHVLDWEDPEDNHATRASLAECALALHRLHDVLDGNWPMLYGSNLVVQAYQVGRFRGIPLMVARYSNQPPVIPWKLWQFASGESKKGPSFGGHYHDVNTFNGGQAECADWLKTLA